MGYSSHQWGCDQFLLGEHILQRSTFNDSWIASQLSIGGYHHSWKFVNGEQSCADLSVLHCSDTVIPTKEKFFQLCPEKNIFGFPFLLSFVLVKVPPPKKHQQPKKKSVIHHIYVFLGGAYPPPKKRPHIPNKTPDPAFQQFPLTVFFQTVEASKRERWEKLHGKRPNLRMPSPWSYVRSCKSWRRPQVPNARRNAGRWGTGVGSLVC